MLAPSSLVSITVFGSVRETISRASPLSPRRKSIFEIARSESPSMLSEGTKAVVDEDPALSSVTVMSAQLLSIE